MLKCRLQTLLFLRRFLCWREHGSLRRVKDLRRGFFETLKGSLFGGHANHSSSNAGGLQ